VRFALCDCNNFFVSCERLLRPDLAGKPVIVLSCNDGCVISRSNEAKALGIPMAEPFFKIRALAEARGVAVFSTNFALYHEVSRRVMAVLSRYTDHMETYSVDEAFLDLSIASLADPVAYARGIRRTLLEEIGIPVSIGIASTKTLAKLAADRGKKDPETGGVFSLEGLDLDAFLEKIPVGDVWGIGRRCTESLSKFGIRTARQFRDAKDDWLRQHFSVRGVHTAWELRGISCIRLVEEDPAQKSIQASRSFGTPVTDPGKPEGSRDRPRGLRRGTAAEPGAGRAGPAGHHRHQPLQGQPLPPPPSTLKMDRPHLQQPDPGEGRAGRPRADLPPPGTPSRRPA